MRALGVVLLTICLIAPLPAGADDHLVRFEGGIGVIPTSRVDPPVPPSTVPVVTRNDVRGVQPGGQPWVIAALTANVRVGGRISVDGRGLLLAGGNGIGTNGGQSVQAVLFCGPAATASAHSSDAVALDPDGDFHIQGILTPAPPDPCETPVLLIVSTAGRWFAAGIPRD